jgi:hypothetical protein
MPYKLRLNLPTVPKGQEVAFTGLGAFANGSEHEVTDEQAELFRLFNGTQEYEEGTEPNELGQRPVVLKQGPTLVEAFKAVDGVTVVKVKETQSEGVDK